MKDALGTSLGDTAVRLLLVLCFDESTAFQAAIELTCLLAQPWDSCVQP